MLVPLYQRLGVDATFAHAGGSPRAVKVVFDYGGGAGALGGMQLMAEPSLRIQASDAPQGVSRGDLFRLGGTTWRAREAGMPIGIGDEIQVPIAQDA